MKITLKDTKGNPFDIEAAGVPWNERGGLIYTYISGAKNYLKRGVHSGGQCFCMVTPEVVAKATGKKADILDPNSFPQIIGLADDEEDEEQVQIRAAFEKWRKEVGQHAGS